MKYTGWAVLAIGVLIGAYGLFTLTMTDPTPAAMPAGEPGAKPFPIAYVLLPFALVALVAGGAMIAYGGSGVIRTRNLATRR